MSSLRGSSAWVFSSRSPCGWVPCTITRTVERGRKRGWFVLGFAPGSSYEGRVGRKRATVDPDLVKLKGESLPPMGGANVLAALGISKDRGRR